MNRIEIKIFNLLKRLWCYLFVREFYIESLLSDSDETWSKSFHRISEDLYRRKASGYGYRTNIYDRVPLSSVIRELPKTRWAYMTIRYKNSNKIVMYNSCSEIEKILSNKQHLILK